MTIAELIAKLAGMPTDAVVMVYPESGAPPIEAAFTVYLRPLEGLGGNQVCIGA